MPSRLSASRDLFGCVLVCSGGVIASAARRSSRRAGRPTEKRPLERGRELLDGFGQLAVRAERPVHRPRTPVSSALRTSRLTLVVAAALLQRFVADGRNIVDDVP
jgi:hypothetical protein